MVNLNDRLEDVGDPSSESNDHEKAAFRKPIVSSEGDDVPAVSLGDSVKESSRSVFCKKSLIRSKDTLPVIMHQIQMRPIRGI